MLTKKGLHTLLGLEVAGNAPMIEIYSEHITPRLEYTCHFIFAHVLNLRFKMTDKLEEVNTSGNPVINYSSQILTSALQIVPYGLLSEKKITENKPTLQRTNELIYLYPSGTAGTSKESIKFDVFAAVFYAISRIEEWQSFETDAHQRFEAAASLFFKEGFHLKPVVDIWILELKKALMEKYPAVKFPEKEFRVVSTIDVDNLYAFKHKGLMRTIGSSVRDLIKSDFKNFTLRVQVLRGKRNDPFDIYESVSDFCFEKKIPLIYFFLFKTGTKHDRTVAPRTGAFGKVFSILKKNQALFGLHPSYNSAYQSGMLTSEIDDLSARSKERITLSRQHYLRFDIRSTPALLLRNGIEADFTMGFASSPGFRAGTSHPFYYYDFNKERSTELLFVPFCAMDGAYTVYTNTGSETAFDSMMDLAKEVKKVNGLYITVFHERSFFDHLYKGFGSLYKNLHAKVKDL